VYEFKEFTMTTDFHSVIRLHNLKIVGVFGMQKKMVKENRPYVAPPLFSPALIVF